MLFRLLFLSFAFLFGLSLAALADQVAILNSPDDIMRSRMGLIEQSQNEILASDFIFRGDRFGLMKVAALIDARKRGAISRNLIDAPHFMLSPAHALAAMEEGVEFRLFNPTSASNPGRSSVRFHDKAIVSDNREYQVGGTNTGDEYHGMAEHNLKDRDARVLGESANGAREHFYEIWNSDWVRVPKIIITSSERVAEFRAARAKRKARLDKIIRVLEKFGNPKSAAQLSNEVGSPISQKEFDALERVHFKIELDSPDLGAGSEPEYITQAELDQARRDIAKARQEWHALKAAHGWNRPKVWYDPADGDSKVTFLADKLGKKGKLPGGIADIELEAAKAAKSSWVMSTPYLVLSEHYGYKDLLTQLPGGRVSKTVLTNSYASSDNKMTQGHYEMNLGKTAKLGLDLHEFQGPDTLHAKTLVIDGTVAFIGSVNKDPRSALLNTETGIRIESPRIARKVEAMIQEDIKASKLVASGGQLLVQRKFCATAFGRLFLKAIEGQL